MDPLGARPVILQVDSITRWPDATSSSDPLTSTSVIGTDLPNAHTSPPFSVRPDLNTKLAIFTGDITKIAAEAIVNPTNESLTDKNPVSLRILEVAGPELKEDMKTQVVSCRTGDAKITTAHSLPARHVIHTVGPRYNIKYRTAAESALYNCYRSVMQMIRNRKIATVAIPTLVSCRRNYPPVDGASIALRTIRRFLEHYGDEIDLVVFVSDQDDIVYQQIATLYFPRNKEEEEFSMRALPLDLGNEFGEPVIAERQIRISDIPFHKEDDDDDEEEGSNEDVELVSPEVGQHPFAMMTADHDQARKERIASTAADVDAEEDRQRRYRHFLGMARTENFSELNKLGALYRAGQDHQGSQIVVYVGRLFPAPQFDLNKVVGYFTSLMDPIVQRSYVLVYFHTEANPEKQPDSTFFKELYGLLGDKYKRNLKSLYIVHSNFWFRMSVWWFLTFTASEIKDKIQHLTGVEMLYDTIPPDQITIPKFVLDFDQKANGTNYYRPIHKPKSQEEGL